MFAEGNAEFDSCREVVQGLMDEYHAAEGANYTTWGTDLPADDAADGRSAERYGFSAVGGAAHQTSY
jgi:hypothetical protein